MNLKEIWTKKISLLLIISIISINLSFLTVPKKANAGAIISGYAFSTGIEVDPGTLAFYTHATGALALISSATGATEGTVAAQSAWETIGKYLKDGLIAGLAKQFALSLINQITQATVDWINGGMNKPPSYVSNLNKFLTGPGGVADSAVGNFINNEPALRFLCNPFKFQVTLALQLQYGGTLINNLGCTYTAIAKNVQGAIDNSSVVLDVNGNPITITRSNFDNKGGWNAWLLQTMQPQNNPIGSYLIAKDAMDQAIEKNKTAAASDLNFGQGALSFKTCVDVYYDIDGNKVGQSSWYIDNSGVPGSWPANQAAKMGEIDQECTVKTPGSVITAQIRTTAGSAQKMTEIQAATANGIDAIIGTLIQALIKAAMDKIKNGILDNSKTPATQNYQNVLNTAIPQIEQTYNNELNDVNTNGYTDYGTLIIDQINSDPSNWTYDPGTGQPFTFSTSTWIYDPSTGLPYVFGTSTLSYNASNWKYDPITGEPSTWNYNPVTGQTFTSNTSTSANTNTYDALTIAKNNANALMSSLLNSELAYQNNYKIAQNLLTQAEKVFATSSSCNISYNRNNTVLRSLLIRANVISNIDGVSNSDRTIASITWNLQAISAALKASDAKIAILNKAASDVSGAGSITLVTNAMSPVNSTSFDTDPQANMVGNIKTWLRGVQSMYDSILCPIDLTGVLKITSATTTTNQL